MSSATSIALMVIGAILVLTPLVLGFELREHMMMAHSLALAANHATGAARPSRGGRLYALICLVTGLGCLITGIVRSRNTPNSPATPIIHRPAG